MIKRILGIMLLSAIICGQLKAHSGKPKYHVIIDTDGALDDMRSISMFLSGNDIRILAITCSQGTLLPDSVYVKINSLLLTFHHEGIPVGIAEKINKELPVWASFAQNIKWGDSVSLMDLNFKNNAADMLNKTVENYRDKITLVALGSLKTYADWIRTNPQIVSKIERIVWYNNLSIENGFNYRVSPESYEFIKQAGIALDIVENNSDKFLIDEAYLTNIKNTNSVYAKQIGFVHNQSQIIERINQKHLQLWDDIIPLYLTVPIIFESKTTGNIRYISINKSIPESFIYETIAKLLESATSTNNRVFNNFPVDSSLYKPKYVKILNSTIKKFGLTEWKAISMTNEIHGHTGIYSIIGAKIGIRAMEYFNVGVNNLSVTTFAGSKPPLSCFNDGIQISTGATIGQGLITVSDSISIIPSAIFEFNNQKVKISLKPEIAAKMQEEIKYGIENYDLLTEQYWLYIEELAIRYWTSFDRHEIFNFTLVSNNK
ncbi:MAG: nucleoside hydrolase [Bacteroidales bacterium]|nr:nucleoside hydrolase [Bacteroidales bacterium]